MVSFLLGNDFAKIDLLLKGNKLIILFSQELLDEFVDVVRRPRLRKYFVSTDLQNLIATIRSKAEFIPVTSTISLCRDEKDNFLLALAIDGNASHLLTGDKDLLVLKEVGKTKIATMTDYLSRK